ncbi:2Fe-2S iron-sulfur cluster-binding protein [Mycolicibacterium sp. P9-22]|uniref:2Fe-2S iron-sulfur cluster-binding protein n=1 Tax=Mycolicibacterium sp. P9-22 TaxID=2024613 RepID=UPI0011ECA5B5|nr:2Fe-2S iron-sulfur cluster binding domain-containing protein [Mycolicibacterium sp. P9-22]KAA0120624.1 ferredoxin [Mycolicibacterium sp. P9-22]
MCPLPQESLQRCETRSTESTRKGPPVPTVTVQPAGITLRVQPGETVFHAAQAAGVRWPTVCGGQGSCRLCFMLVERGQENLAEIGAWEAEGLEQLGSVGTDTRLACQARVHGDVTVTKRGVRRSAPAGG